MASHTEYYKLKEGNLEKLWYVKLRMYVCRHIRSVEPSAKYSRNQWIILQASTHCLRWMEVYHLRSCLSSRLAKNTVLRKEPIWPSVSHVFKPKLGRYVQKDITPKQGSINVRFSHRVTTGISKLRTAEEEDGVVVCIWLKVCTLKFSPSLSLQPPCLHKIKRR